MQSQLLNIEIGKTYPATTVLQIIQEKPNLEIRFGHIVIEHDNEKRHKYFVDENCIKNLNITSMTVLTIMTKPNCQNFACRLLEQTDIKQILENVKKDNNLCCVIDENDLKKANYNHKGIKKAISLINKVFKANNMTFKASSHPEGIKIIYKKM